MAKMPRKKNAVAAKPAETGETPGARARARAEADKRARFVDFLSRGVSVTTSAKGVGVGRATAYRWRKNEDFARAWDEARESGLDRLEDLALKYAQAGDAKLIMFLLKAGRPEKYRERHQHSHDHAGSVDVNVDEVRSGIQGKLARVATAAATGQVALKPKR